MIKKLLLRIFLSVLSIFVFWYLESGLMIKNGDELIKSIIFGATLFIATLAQYRKYLFLFSFFLLGFMITFYLFWQMTWADRLGSLGFGILVITTSSYILRLLKNGFVEKL